MNTFYAQNSLFFFKKQRKYQKSSFFPPILFVITIFYLSLHTINLYIQIINDKILI